MRSVHTFTLLALALVSWGSVVAAAEGPYTEDCAGTVHLQCNQCLASRRDEATGKLECTEDHECFAYLALQVKTCLVGRTISIPALP